jgi:hypothetical protein
MNLDLLVTPLVSMTPLLKLEILMELTKNVRDMILALPLLKRK